MNEAITAVELALAAPGYAAVAGMVYVLLEIKYMRRDLDRLYEKVAKDED